MFVHVTKVSYIEGYQLYLTFNNGLQKAVDLKDELDGEIFQPLTDLVFFQQVYLNDETGTIEWPNGADFAPEFLFEIGVEVQQKKHKDTLEELVAA
jgi:hypothetical protein